MSTHHKTIVLLFAVGSLVGSASYLAYRSAHRVQPETHDGGLTIRPGERAVMSSDGGFRVIDHLYFLSTPKQDITAYELALLLPYFAGPSYGDGPYHTGGVIVPRKDGQHGGWPVGGTVLSWTEFEMQKLGTAMRYLEKLP